MKQKLLLALLALFTGVGTLCAQTWTGNEVAEGTFYLYNVGAQKYLNNGDPAQEWGTNAYLQAGFGLDVTLNQISDGVYTIDTGIKNSDTQHYLASSTWTDGNATNWTFRAVEGETNVYQIIYDGQYLMANEDLNDVEMVGDPGSRVTSTYWKLVSEDDFKAAMRAKSYSTTNPMDVSIFIKGRSFARNDSRNSKWITTHNGGNWTWIGGSDNKYYGNEAWNNTFDVHQAITGLPEGTYEIQCSGFGTNGTTYIYGNATSKAIQTDNATSYGNSKEAKWKAIHEDNAFAGQTTGTFTVGDGNLTVGIKRETNQSGDWAIWDEFRLYYYGLDLSEFAASLDAAVIQAEALEGTIPSATYTALEAVVTENNKTYTTVEDYTTAINAIIEATNAAKALQIPYSNYAIVKARMQTIKNASGFTDPNNAASEFDNAIANQDAAVEQATSVDAIQACIDAVRTAAGTFLGAVEITGTVDATALIMNDTPTSNGDFWTLTGTAAFDAGNNVAEYYNQGGVSIKQIIYGLPAGYYKLTAVALTRTNYVGTLSAGENTMNIATVGSGTVNGLSGANTWFNDGNGVNSLSFRLDNAGNVEVGITTDKNNGDHWTVWRSFKLEYLAPIISVNSISLNPTDINLSIGENETLTATLSPANANTGTDITWSTDDATIATVADGVVTAIGIGTAMITATTANNCTATCQVTVNDVTPVDAPAYYSEVAAGDFYIVNAATGKYLGGANSWGTQASLIEHGIPFTVALNDGKYTLDSHTYNNNTDHFLNGEFIDKPSTDLYIVSLGNGKYSISTSDDSNYLSAHANNTVVDNTAANANSVLAQWYFVSKDNLVKTLSDATNAKPADATFYIGDQNFSRNYLVDKMQNGQTTTYYEGEGSYPWTISSTNYNLKGGANDNMCAESWHAAFTLSQALTVPNGMYKLRAQAAANGTPSEIFIYANDETAAFNALAHEESSMSSVSNSFSADEYHTDWIIVYVTDGSLTIGAKTTNTGSWCIWDNFELYYYGPTIGGEADALADPMEANKWYYFDIPAEGDYNLTLDNRNDVVYTTDGSILIENQSSVTATFGENPVTLTAGRYYVKSASTQTLTVAVNSYAYSVGEATLSVADGGYTQSNTFTVTFPHAETNDPDGTAALVASSTATVNGESVNLTAVENGFCLDLGELTANCDYVIAIPANVYGYDGQSMNDAINITIHTPVVFDGFYFLRTSADKYVARGGDYNSRAVVDEFGLPLSVATDASGKTQFTYIDNEGKLFLNGQGNAYTDNSTDPNWTFEATEGGYYLVHADGDYDGKKLNIWEGSALYATTTEGAVFIIEPVSEHNTHMEALKDAQAATAAEALGNTTISTKADLAEWLTANYTAVPITVDAVSFTEKWNGAASAEWGAGKDMYIATVNDLPAGLYKLTVNAYYRLNASATAAEGARANVYLYGNDVKTQLYSIHEFPATEPWVSGNDQQDSYGYYPNNPTGGEAALTAGNYLTELYVYHTGGDFIYGIHQPSRFSNQQWFGFQNFTLTRYAEKPEIVTVTVNKNASDADGYCYGTLYYSDKNLVVPEGLTAYTYIVTDGTLSESKTYETGAVIPAATGVVVKTANNSLTENASFDFTVTAESGEVDNNNMLHGTDEAAMTNAGDGNWKYYALSLNSSNTAGTVGFYFRKGCPNGQAFQNGAHKAYLAVPVAQAKGMSGFAFGSETDGIGQIENAELTMENATIYNLTGQKVNNTQKGVYIVNGKKVVIK